MIMTEEQDDYDSPWKKALEWYFEDFMAFFFPGAHAQIDWNKPVEFMDKELQQAVKDTELGRRYADKLGKVWTKIGKEEWVLAHVEVAGRTGSAFRPAHVCLQLIVFSMYMGGGLPVLRF